MSDPLTSSASTLFQWGNISVRQPENILKVGTDAILLGSWVAGIEINPSSILDVGTGTGILSLLMAQRFDQAIIKAIDTDIHAVACAKENFIQSPWNTRMSALHEDVFIFAETKMQFDLVICNPPFYFGDLKSPDISRSTSKHTMHSIEEWMHALASKVSAAGFLAIVIPYDKSQEWIEKANECTLFAGHRMDVRSYKEDLRPVRSMLVFRRQLRKPETLEITIYDKPGTHSQAYQTLTKRSKRQYIK
jgi:tRNA1Val (adenine37-N6)-methyltransferase